MKPKEYSNHLEEKKLTIFDIFQKKKLFAPSTVKKHDQKIQGKPLKLENIAINIYSNDGKLDLIPSTLELMEIEITPGAENRLKNFINKIKDAYDYIIIDCPPRTDFFTQSAFIASEAYLIPIKSDFMSSFGLPLLERALDQYQLDYEIKLIQLGVVFTMVKNTILSRDTVKLIKSTNRYVFSSMLRDSTKVAEAAIKNKPLFDYTRAKDYAIEIDNITNELLNRIEEVSK